MSSFSLPRIVMCSLCQAVMVKKELNQKAKLSICWSSYAPHLTNDHELGLMNKRTRLPIQAAKILTFHLAGKVFRTCANCRRHSVGGTLSLGWLRNALGSWQMSWRRWLGQGKSGRLCRDRWPRDPTRDNSAAAEEDNDVWDSYPDVSLLLAYQLINWLKALVMLHSLITQSSQLF